MGLGQVTTNCFGSGQAALLNFLTAIHDPFMRRPLYTELGALSPLSDTMNSELKLLVEAMSSERENPVKAGTATWAGSGAAEGGGWFCWMGPWALGSFSGWVSLKGDDSQQPMSPKKFHLFLNYKPHVVSETGGEKELPLLLFLGFLLSPSSSW